MRVCPMVLLMLRDTNNQNNPVWIYTCAFWSFKSFTSLSSTTAFHVVSNYYWGARAE
jgi:hypothetical protein